MGWHEDLVARLKANEAIAALAGDRVAFFERPARGSLPSLTLTEVDPGVEWNLDAIEELERPRVQIDVWAETRTDSDALARAVRAEMERNEDVTIGGTTFEPPGSLELSFQGVEDMEGAANSVRRWTQDFSFFQRQAV